MERSLSYGLEIFGYYSKNPPFLQFLTNDPIFNVRLTL
jgi:hypothetical protein